MTYKHTDVSIPVSEIITTLNVDEAYFKHSCMSLVDQNEIRYESQNGIECVLLGEKSSIAFTSKKYLKARDKDIYNFVDPIMRWAIPILAIITTIIISNRGINESKQNKMQMQTLQEQLNAVKDHLSKIDQPKIHLRGIDSGKISHDSLSIK